VKVELGAGWNNRAPTEMIMSQERSQQELIDLGVRAIESAEFGEALEIFSQVAVEGPANPVSWFYLGLCYLETGQPDLAAEALDRAIAADPNYADAHYLRGTVLGATGQTDRAAEYYRKALEIDPGHYKAEEFLIRTEALIESRKHYKEAMRLIYSPEREDDWFNRAVRELLNSTAIFGDSPAKTEFKSLAKYAVESGTRTSIHESPDAVGSFWVSTVRQGERAFENNWWMEAITGYQQALDLSPDHAFIHHVLGSCYFAIDEVTNGMRAWQHVIDLEFDYDFCTVPVLAE
jgi:tetratricopeptide (TPR) repeat protein